MAETPPNPVGQNPIYGAINKLSPVTPVAPVTSAVSKPMTTKSSKLKPVMPKSATRDQQIKAVFPKYRGQGLNWGTALTSLAVPRKAAAILKGAPDVIIREGKAFADLTKHMPGGMAHFIGGLAVDAGELALQSKSFGLYHAPDPGDTTYGEAAKSFLHTLSIWKTVPEYLNAIDNGEALTPLIVRDAGNLSIMFHGLGAIAKGAGVAAAERAAMRGAEAARAAAAAEPGIASEAYAAMRGDKVARAAETQAAVDAAAKAARRAERYASIATKADRFGVVTGPALHYTDWVGAAPFKPYIYLGKGLGSLVRDGVYVGNHFSWGRRAAEAYAKQLDDLRAAEPDVSLQDDRVKDLLRKFNSNNRIALSHATRSKIRQALRNSLHEKSAMSRRLNNETVNPLYREEINPQTNQKWGGLSGPEQEAVIAIINGRAHLIKWLSDNLGITPEQISQMGRYDATPEYHLSAEGARLAIDFLDGETSGMQPQQYDRLGHATQNLLQSIQELTQKAVNGEGRRNALSPEYLQPVPFASKVLAAIKRFGSETAKDIAAAAEDAGIFDLPVDDARRIKLLQYLVDQLPDEVALDPSMYPANMRENIEFYRRLRRAYNREVIGGAEGEPIPPRDGGPRAPQNPWYPFEGEAPEGPEQFRTTAGRGALTAVTKEMGKTKKLIKKFSDRVTKIQDRIAVAEEQHAKISQRVKKYDIIDAYVDGQSIKSIAKKFRISVADAQVIIENSPVAKAADRMRAIEARMAELEKVIGKKRASMDPGAMDQELAQLTEAADAARKEANAAQKSLAAARNINEIARQADESAVDRVVSEIDKLEDEVMDAETALENVGGDPQALRVQVEPNDPSMGPVTIQVVRAQLNGITEFIDNQVVPSMEGNVPDSIIESIQKVSTLLKGVWDQAENNYFDAATPEQVSVAAMRLEQLGQYISDLNDRLNEAYINPPNGVTPDTAIADVLMNVVNQKRDQAILSGKTTPVGGSAPLSKLNEFVYPEDPSFLDMTDLFPWDDPHKVLNSAPESKASKMLDAIVADFADPLSLPDPGGATYMGDIPRMAVAINQLSRWFREVMDAKGNKNKIDLILNPPDYVNPELAKRVMRGVSRDKIGDGYIGEGYHPLTKFSRAMGKYLEDAVKDVHRIYGHVDEFGTITHVNWREMGRDYVTVRRPYDPNVPYEEVAFKFPSIREWGSMPELTFNTSTPKESIIQALDALETAVRNGDGYRIYVSEYYPKNSAGWYVGIKGLTKKLSRYQEGVLNDIKNIRSQVEKLKETSPESFVYTDGTSKDLLPGITKETEVPLSVSPESPSSNQPKLATVDEVTGATVEVPIKSAEQPGAYELHPDFEFFADQLANDAELLDEWRATRDNAVAYEQELQAARNPSPEELQQYKASMVAEATNTVKEAVNFAVGTMQQVRVDPRTGMPRFFLSPERTPEWDWWWKLDPRFRRRIARDYFQSAEMKSNAAKGPRFVRQAAMNIETYADILNTDIAGAADRILEIINVIEKAKRDLRSARDASIESLADEYSKITLDELDRYSNDFELTAREYNDIVSRAEYKAGLESTSALPAEMRMIADNPTLVRVDRSLADTNVRDAAYEADVIDSMAKQATSKMKKAERAVDRLKALEEYIEQSKRYRAEADRLISKQKAAQKARLSQAKNEERQVKLRERRAEAKKKLRTVSRKLQYLETHPGTEQIGKLKGNVPLRVAMEGTYPTDIAGLAVDVPTPEGGVRPQNITGPMYVPTGKPAEFQGGIAREVTREGLDGFNRLSSDHYRDGDRHTIFSVRLLAKRMGEEARRISENEAFRSIVAQWGQKPIDVIGEEAAKKLWQTAYDRASSMPEAELLSMARSIADEAALAGESLTQIAGIDAFSMGVPNPKIAFDLAVKEYYGQLLAREMAFRGFKVIDPYGSIDSVIRNSRITHESMFVPEFLRESVANIRSVIDPTSWQAWLRGAQGVTKFFKTTTLVLSVPWQLGDLISSVIISHMSGVDAKSLIKRMKQVIDIEYGGPRQMFRQVFSPTEQLMPIPSEVAKIAIESPVQDISLALEERRSIAGLKPLEEKQPLLTKLTGKEYPKDLRGRSPVKISFKINETINRIARHAHFLEVLDKTLEANGMSLERVAETGEWRRNPEIKAAIEQAADTANKWLGDYANLTMLERKYITPFIPFYAWTKHIHQVFYALGLDHPQSLRWYIYIGSLGFDPNEDPMGLRYGGMNLFGGTVSTNFLNPLGDVAGGALASYLLEGDVRPALQQIGPSVRLAAGLGAGFDISKLGPISRPPGSGNYSLTGQEISTPLLRNPTEALGFTLQQFPISQRILNVLPTGNIPGTRIATGSYVKYPTGEARLRPYSNERLPKWGGQLAAVGRLFSLPGIPTQADQQIEEITAAAKKRLRTVETLKKRRENQKNP